MDPQLAESLQYHHVDHLEQVRPAAGRKIAEQAQLENMKAFTYVGSALSLAVSRTILMDRLIWLPLVVSCYTCGITVII